MREFPAFLFYPEDFAAGTADMSPLEVGVYVRCLCHQWSHGCIPNEVAKVARISGATPEEAKAAWPSVSRKFIDNGAGSLINTRLELERGKLASQSRRRTKAGKKGAKARWQSHSNRNADAMPNRCEDDGKTMASRVANANVNANANAHGDATGLASKINAVVKHYQGHHPQAKAGKLERSKISARLKDGFSVEDLQIAIDGCHVSRFHCGENDAGRKYQSLELVMRDASKTTQFIELAAEQGGPQLSEKSKRSLEALNRFVLRQSHDR